MKLQSTRSAWRRWGASALWCGLFSGPAAMPWLAGASLTFLEKSAAAEGRAERIPSSEPAPLAGPAREKEGSLPRRSPPASVSTRSGNRRSRLQVPELQVPDARKLPAVRAPSSQRPGAKLGGDVRVRSDEQGGHRAVHPPAATVEAGTHRAEAGRAESLRQEVGGGQKSEPVHKNRLSAAIDSLAFENGDIPNAAAALEHIKRDFAKCASTESGPLESGATVELRFIVRAPGRAEGVDVGRVRGVSSNIVRCMTSSLSLRPVGTPSSDPVGVTTTIRFTKD
jgi:hypothetical protein